jgi:hypothetical protein
VRGAGGGGAKREWAGGGAGTNQQGARNPRPSVLDDCRPGT